MRSTVSNIVQAFARLYPKPKKFLHSKTAYQHLVATILSAQCTDKRVNMITPGLFIVAGTPAKMMSLGENRLQSIIKPCGFYRVKSKSILSMSRDILEKFHGKVPKTIDELTTLAGVGRKTASIIVSQIYGKPAFPVDTHVFRVANRIGLAHANTVEKTEMQLREAVLPKFWHDLHLQLVLHGRNVCKAPRPLCFQCDVQKYCEAYHKTFKNAYEKTGMWAKFL